MSTLITILFRSLPDVELFYQVLPPSHSQIFLPTGDRVLVHLTFWIYIPKMEINQENVKVKYDQLMKMAGDRWSETLYFKLCKAVGAHVINDWNFMRYYEKDFEKLDDIELITRFNELYRYLYDRHKELTFFVQPDHHYYPKDE